MRPIELGALVTYLTRTGWSPTGNTWHGGVIWEQGQYEVLVPPRDGMIDAESRVHELLRTLAEVEDRRSGEIARDLAYPFLDRASYRGDAESAVDGFVALPTGIDSLRGLHDMLYAVAPQPAALSGVLLHTAFDERELATILVPGQGDGRILRQLYDATAAVHAALATESLDQVVDAGVAPAFCVALGRLSAGGLGAFELEFRWARGLPSEAPDTQLTFGAGAGEQIGRVTRRLEQRGKSPRDPAPSGPGTLEGRVVGLQDAGNRDNRWRVRVHGPVANDTRPRSVWAGLASQEQYEQAWDAHRRHLRVRISGQWTPDGRVRLRADPDGLTVLPDS
ncbi:hypothetical protein GCM10029976_010200 [Kribbella albertanoniae]|uniref:Uncharacterized protein n=1 Tax=Kribbella albertanoniae TaxID=1266829 RepID=A0A4R4P5N3_9ACTN|nr:hypothetical protein [Kribbella albertanoniae]TDC16123.1 hypothetical protein E1261_39540 [Kribbella albertanoniae]